MKSRAAIVLVALAAIGCVQAAETCVPGCNEIYKPVCGSDGKTYENQCTFDYKKCSTNDTALKVVSEGECGSSSGSAGGTVCEKGCTKIIKPVCGSDGKTYSNDCELTNAKCKNATLTKVSDGECGSSAGSGNVGCGSTKCTSDYTPVCGSDGKTYSNECQLKVAQCSDPSLKLDSNGECSGFSRTGSIGGEASQENSTDPSPTPSSTVPSPTSAPASSAVVVAAVQVVASTLLAAVALLN